jgi:hypothetical protein
MISAPPVDNMKNSDIVSDLFRIDDIHGQSHAEQKTRKGKDSVNVVAPITAAAVVPAVAQSSSSIEGALEGAASVRTAGPESLLITSGAASLLSAMAKSADLFIMAPKNLFLEDPKNMGLSPSSAFSLFMFSAFNMRRFSFSPMRRIHCLMMKSFLQNRGEPNSSATILPRYV